MSFLNVNKANLSFTTIANFAIHQSQDTQAQPNLPAASRSAGQRRLRMETLSRPNIQAVTDPSNSPKLTSPSFNNSYVLNNKDNEEIVDIILKYSDRAYSPIFSAAGHGDEHAVRRLIEYGFDSLEKYNGPNLGDQILAGDPLLAFAIMGKNLSLIKFLCEEKKASYERAVVLCAKIAYWAGFDYFMELGMQMPDNIITAAYYPSASWINALLSRGAKTDCLKNQNRLLSLAIIHPLYPNDGLVNLLIEHGAADSSSSLPWDLNFNPLCAALFMNRADYVDAILKSGVKLNQHKETWHFIQYHNYCNHDFKKMLKLLLETGLDTNIQFTTIQQENLTPIQFAIQLNDPELLRIILVHGADPNKPMANGIKPLSFALQNRMKEIAVLLLDFGAKIN
jgi:hypothetical protein